MRGIICSITNYDCSECATMGKGYCRVNNNNNNNYNNRLELSDNVLGTCLGSSFDSINEVGLSTYMIL